MGRSICRSKGDIHFIILYQRAPGHVCSHTHHIQVTLTSNHSYRILLDALKALMDFHSIITIGYEALQKYPKDPYIVKIITEFEVYYSKKYNYTPKPEDSVVDDAGRKIAVRYPWSPVQFHTRSQEVINQINAEISTATHDLLEVRESQVGGENTGCLGVFAKQDIAAGTEVFNSLGPINVRSDQMEVNICYNCFGPNSKLRFTIGCCHTLRLCSPECQDIAMNTYHKALCGKDFKGLYEKAKAGIYKGMGSDEAPPFASLLWLRILACCVAEKEVHPLEGRTFGRLGSVQSVSVRWTLMGKVVAPIQVLQGLGIDVFADGRYDQWVLEEIWARLSGNYVNEEGAFEPSLDTVYSMFNHSCELNHQLTKGDSTVAAAPSQSSRFQPTAPSPLRTSLLAPVETGSRKIFLAKREMERDSEVFVSYVDFRDQMGKNEREKELEHWVGSGGCGCTRCKRE